MLCLRMQEQVCASVGSVDQIGVARRPARISYQQMMCVCCSPGAIMAAISPNYLFLRERNDRERGKESAGLGANADLKQYKHDYTFLS